MSPTPKLAWVLVPLTLMAAACVGPMTPATTARHADGTQDLVVLVFNKGTTPVIDGAIYLDDICVARATYAPGTTVAGAPRVRLRLTPGVHRLRADFAGASAVAEVSIDSDGRNLDSHGENIWEVTYRDKPLDLGFTVVPPGIIIERIQPC